MTDDSEYNTEYGIRTDRANTRIVVRIDSHRGDVERFVVQLQYTERLFSPSYETIAQFDHAPNTPNGHDVYSEGLHIDLYRVSKADLSITPTHPPLTQSEGGIIRACTDYFQDNLEYFIRVHRGEIQPENPPPWP